MAKPDTTTLPGAAAYIKQLEQIVAKYAQHETDCPCYDHTGEMWPALIRSIECRCGFREALAEVGMTE